MPVSAEEQEIPEALKLWERVKMYEQADFKILIGMVAYTELWKTFQAGW